MWKDFVYSLRSLRRSPLFTAAAVASLALGIGANTAIFSLLDQVVLRSLPVRDPQSLVVLHTDYNAPGGANSDNYESVFSYPLYRDLRATDPAFSGILARGGAGLRLAWSGNTESASADLVSGNYFQTLGVGAALGRTLAPSDEGAPGANPVVMLSHAYWSSHFGADPAILNRTVALNGHPFVVVGVVEAKFHGLTQGNSPDLFVPLTMEQSLIPNFDVLSDRRMRWLDLFARLKPGESLSRAQASSDVAYHAILVNELAEMRDPPHDERDRQRFLNHRAALRPAAQGIAELREKWEKPLRVLIAMVGLVLLIACANVAGLMVARSTGRQREIAIRLAMGARRSTLVRQLLIEGLILALAGGVAGLMVEYWSTAALLRVLPRDEAGGWLTASLDLHLLVYAFAISLACGLLFALLPALQATRPDFERPGAQCHFRRPARALAAGPGIRAARAFPVACGGRRSVQLERSQPLECPPGIPHQPASVVRRQRHARPATGRGRRGFLSRSPVPPVFHARRRGRGRGRLRTFFGQRFHQQYHRGRLPGRAG